MLWRKQEKSDRTFFTKPKLKSVLIAGFRNGCHVVKKDFVSENNGPDSTSKCNTPPKDLCRGGKSKTLSRSIVEPTLDRLYIFAL